MLSEIQNCKNLKPVSSCVTTPDGRVFIEKNGELTLQNMKTCGFVPDLKPDLQVACVLPNLIMGSQDVAASEQLLKEYKVTHVLSLVELKFPLPNGITHHYVQCLDVPEEALPINECINFITSATGCVLVHCNAGVSRSAAVVIAYLMYIKSWTYLEAFDFLKTKRPCIKPNDGFIKQLLKYEEVIVKKSS